MARVFTGAKAIIRFDGFPIVFVSSISVQHENRLEEIPQLDELEVAEYAENGHRCEFTIELFKVDNNTAFSLGLDPNNIKDLIAQPENIVEVVDSTTGLPVYTMRGCRFAGGSGSVDARGVWRGTWRFKARRGQGL